MVLIWFYGADGDFGKTTEKVIKSFQSSFTPTYVHHQGYSIGPSDGIVGKGTLHALDEVILCLWCLAKFDYKMSPEGCRLLQSVEELRLLPYDDQTGKTITEWLEGATIGYGYLIPEDEWDIYKDGITREMAETLFLKH